MITRTATDWQNDARTRRAYDAGQADGIEAGRTGLLDGSYDPAATGDWGSDLVNAVGGDRAAQILTGADSLEDVDSELWDLVLLAYSAGCQDGYGSVQS